MIVTARRNTATSLILSPLLANRYYKKTLGPDLSTRCLTLSLHTRLGLAPALAHSYPISYLLSRFTESSVLSVYMVVVCCTALLFVHDMMILCPSITYTVTDKTKDPHLPVEYGFTRGFLTLSLTSLITQATSILSLITIGRTAFRSMCCLCTTFDGNTYKIYI